MKAYKIQDQSFGNVFYKTKNAKGTSVFGKGKTNFLDAKYKEKANTQMFNFEKYMINKPENPTIIINDSDNSNNDDNLFGVNTTEKLNSEIEKLANESIITNDNNNTKYVNTEAFANIEKEFESNPMEEFEIVFEDPSVTLENSSTDGGAITETYETPTIKYNNKK